MRSVATLTIDPERVREQVEQLDNMIRGIHEAKHSVRGRLLQHLQSEARLLHRIGAVHAGIAGLWEQRLTEAAARPPIDMDRSRVYTVMVEARDGDALGDALGALVGTVIDSYSIRKGGAA